MSQQNINLFFPVVRRKKFARTSRCYFLELPAKIRRQIYDEAGLPTRRTIHVNFWSTPVRDMLNGYPHNIYRMCDEDRMPAIPVNLFPVCRAVYDELTTILYAENYLVVTRRATRGLRFLERLADSNIAKLKFLVIRLNLATCDDRCCGRCDSNCGYVRGSCCRKHDQPLDCADVSHQPIISQWNRICDRLASSIHPGNLSLYIICDSVNFITAEMMSQSLSPLPTLEDCGIRLATSRDPQISSLAKDTVYKLTNRSPDQLRPGFQFFSLPKEIQLHIMRFAGLSSWLNVYPTRLGSNSRCPLQGSMVPVETPEADSYYLFRCFCERSHSAYNTKCGCAKRGFQTSYFRVSREFRELAMRVLYGSSKISIEGADYLLCEHEHQGQTPGFHRFPDDSLRFFTHLTLHFSYFDVQYMQDQPESWQRWESAITFLLKHANPVILDLEIRFAEKFYISVWGEKAKKREILEQEPEYEAHMVGVYTWFVETLKKALGERKLKRFALHLNWNTSCGNAEGQVWNSGVWSIPVPDGREKVEVRLEELIMGEGYDAWAHGKALGCDLRYYDW